MWLLWCKSANKLDGIPLALELAAVRVKMLTTAQIAERLDRRFHLLTTGNRGALPRHQTLRALVDWSWELLPPKEQFLLRRLSVFAGGATLDAVEAVCTGEGIDDFEILDLLTQLVNKSLVNIERRRGEETRYYLLETIRQYAQTRLAETNETNHYRQYHLDYFCELAEEGDTFVEDVMGDFTEQMVRIDQEANNVREALKWAVVHDPEKGLQMASALGNWWIGDGNLREGDAWISQLISQDKEINERILGKALFVQSHLCKRLKLIERALALAEESVRAFVKSGDEEGVSHSRFMVATIYILIDMVKAKALLIECIASYKKIDHQIGLASTLMMLGHQVEGQFLNNYGQAMAYLEESKQIFEGIDYKIGVANAINYMGDLSMKQENYEEALHYLEESQNIKKELEIYTIAPTIQAFESEIIGQCHYGLGNFVHAIHCFEQSIEICMEAEEYVDSFIVVVRLGKAYLRNNQPDQAWVTLEKGLLNINKPGETFEDVFSFIVLFFTIEGFATLATSQEEPERAVRLYAWADAARASINDSRPPKEKAEVDRDIAVLKEMLDEETYQKAYQEGHAFTIQQAIAYALEEES